MGYKIAIRKVATGETRVWQSEHDWRETPGPEYLGLMEESPDAYWWTEGNGGCDCNRFLHFEYAGQPERPAWEICAELWDKAHCGDGGFTIEYVELAHGRRIRIE